VCVSREGVCETMCFVLKLRAISLCLLWVCFYAEGACKLKVCKCKGERSLELDLY